MNFWTSCLLGSKQREVTRQQMQVEQWESTGGLCSLLGKLTGAKLVDGAVIKRPSAMVTKFNDSEQSEDDYASLD